MRWGHKGPDWCQVFSVALWWAVVGLGGGALLQ